MQFLSVAITTILGIAALLSGMWTVAVGTPQFVRKLTGVGEVESHLTDIERKIESIGKAQRKGHEVQAQQAEAFNELAETVCKEHNIENSHKPPEMDEQAIRDNLGRDRHDFTRGGDD